MKEFTIDEAWEMLLDLGTSEETIQVVTSINGYNLQSLEDILYAQYGYTDFNQIDE